MDDRTTKQAQMALLAAINPSQFIEMAVQQGFSPDRMKKVTKVGLTPGQIEKVKPKVDMTPPIDLFGGVPQQWLPSPAQPLPATAHPEPLPATPPAPTGASAALQQMMGIAPSPMGGRPTTSADTMAAATAAEAQRAQARDAALTQIAPPQQMIPSPSIGAAPTMPVQGPPTPTAAPPTGPSASLQTMMGIGAPDVRPPAPTPPLVEWPSQMPAPIDMAAGGLAGLINGPVTAKAPAPAPAPTTPPVPLAAPKSGPAGIATPGPTPAPLLDVLARTLTGPGGATIPAPTEGIVSTPVDPATMAMSPEGGVGAGAYTQEGDGRGWPGVFNTVRNAMFPPGLIPNLPEGSGTLPPMTGPGAGLGAGAMPTLVGPPAPVPAAPPVVATAPPTPPATPPSGPALKPVTGAGVKTTEPTKTPPTTKTPASAAQVLAQVGKAGLGGGSRRSTSSPGGAGVRMAAIQQGELLDLILKGLIKPANYNPGFIPIGKF